MKYTYKNIPIIDENEYIPIKIVPTPELLEYTLLSNKLDKFNFKINYNYINQFIKIEYETFPIVTQYIDKEVFFSGKKSGYHSIRNFAREYNLWEYKTYTIDNHTYLKIPIKNVLTYHPRGRVKITYYCIICHTRKTSFSYVLKSNFLNNQFFCYSCCTKMNTRKNPEKIKKRTTKTKETVLKKYRVTSTTKLKSVQDKRKKTMLKKYNVENPSQSIIFRQRAKRTMIKKFGKPYAGQVSSCQEKRTMTLFKNNKQMVSKPQKHICNLLNGVLNFPCGNYSLDIVLNNISIAIEYNGSGHDLNVKTGRITKEEFIKKERTRNYFVIRSGWKLMQITSNNDKLPNDNTLLKMINLAKEYLLNTNHSWINIDLNNKCFIFTKEHIKIPFDSLKTIL